MNGKFFWEMVKKEVERQNTSFEWLYQKTKIPKGTFSSWKNRKIIPRADEAYLIANSLMVSIEYLLTGCDSASSISNNTISEISKTIPFLDDYDLQAILATAQAMSDRYKSNKK